MTEQEAIDLLKRKQAEIEKSTQRHQDQPPPETDLGKAFDSLFKSMKTLEKKVKDASEDFKKTIPCAEDWIDKILKVKRYHQKHQELVLYGYEFAWDWFYKRNPRCLTICGESGVGKTYFMKRLEAWAGSMRMQAWEVGGWKGNPPLIWRVYWPDLVASYQDQGKWDDLLPSLAEPSLLLMDDVGKESDRYKSGDNKRILISVLSHRQYKWSVISTNKRPENFSKDWDFATEDRLFRNGGNIVNLFGVPSYNEM